jgi:hypothetical protein
MQPPFMLILMIFLTALKFSLESLVLIGLVTGAYILFLFGCNYLRAFTSPIAALPGPARASLLRGSFPDSSESESVRLMTSWIKKYGRAIRIYSMFGVSSIYVHGFHTLIDSQQNQKLLVVDTKAVHHVLNNGYLYQKSEQVRLVLGAATGKGLLFVEGKLVIHAFNENGMPIVLLDEAHRKQVQSIFYLHHDSFCGSYHRTCSAGL